MRANETQPGDHVTDEAANRANDSSFCTKPIEPLVTLIARRELNWGGGVRLGLTEIVLGLARPM